MIEIKLKDYKTMTYRGMDIEVSPELVQDILANRVDYEEFKNHIHDLYLKNLHIVRNDKINKILEND